MAFSVTFPLDIGTLVVVNDGADLDNPKNLRGRLGTISCYHRVISDKNFIVEVSGYKSTWSGLFLLRKLVVATEEQINAYEKEIGVD